MTVIEKDNRDAAQALTDEALAALARRIHDSHSGLQSRVEAFRSEAGEICSVAITIAREVETAWATLGGRRFKEWWDAQKLPVGWADRYLTLAKTAERHTLGDKDQLRLIGVLPEADGHNEGVQRERTGYEWLKHVGKINSTVTVQDIGRMGAAEQRMAYEKLKPLKALIAALESSLGERR